MLATRRIIHLYICIYGSLSIAQQYYCPECALLLRTYRVGQVGRVGWSAGRGEDMRLLLLEGVSQDRTNEVGAGVDQGQGVLQRIPDRPLETLKRNGRFQTTTRVNCNSAETPLKTIGKVVTCRRLLCNSR